MARAAERAGADAVLLLPPYLVACEQEGLLRHIGAVCRAVAIGVVVYSRNNGIVTPDTALRLAEAHPNLIGVKDGTGNFEALTELKLRAGKRLAIINGVPTAEILAPQCFAIGIRSYSSAAFTFLPALAQRFLAALRQGDQDVVEALLANFYLPLIALRSRKPGYSVSIVKAGLRVAGMPAGPVRPPLVDLSPAEEGELAALVEATRRWSI